MIKRYYAYSLITQTEPAKFSCGVISETSWLPHPHIAFGALLKQITKQFGCFENQIRVEYFGRV